VDLLVGLLLRARRAVAGQLAEVGERGEQGELAVQQLRVVGGELAAGGRVLGHQLAAARGTDVVAGDECLHRRERVQRRRAVRSGRCGVRAGERDPLADGLLLTVAGRVQAHQRRAGVDLGVDHGQHLADPPRERRAHRGLHLHALEDDDRLAGLDLLPGGRPDRDDDGRRRCPHHALLVTGDPVRDPVDLDQVRRGGVTGDDREALAADGEPALQRAEPVQDDVDVPAVELHAVTARGHLRDGQPVDLPAVAQFDRAPHVVRDARSPAPAGREERGPVLRLRGIGDVDGHLHQRYRRVPLGIGAAAGPGAVQPRRVGRAGHDLRAVEQREQEGLGRRPTAQDDGGLADRTAEAGQRLGPVPAPGDDLRNHRVVGRRDDVADGHAGVHADARPGGQAHELHRAGRGRELLLGVLGVEPGLDGVAELGGRVALQPATGGHVDLQLHDVESGRRLRDRVLDLQAGVDLQEREQLLGRLVEELHGARVDVAGRLDQGRRGLAQRGVLLRAERG
jgi:hypothetical protein